MITHLWVYTVQCTVARCILYIVHCTVYTVLCTMHSKAVYIKFECPGHYRHGKFWCYDECDAYRVFYTCYQKCNTHLHVKVLPVNDISINVSL